MPRPARIAVDDAETQVPRALSHIGPSLSQNSPNYFRGQDYYNIYYDQRLSAFRLGIATNRDRAQSEIPQQPVF